MSKAEILEELPRLTVSDRAQLFVRLAELHEADVVEAGAVTPGERQALDEALAELLGINSPLHHGCVVSQSAHKSTESPAA